MPGQTSNRLGRYLYAVAPNSATGVSAGDGIDGKPVYAIAEGPLVALVSDVTNEKIRPERRHLAAHQQLLTRLMDETILLPVSFGVIATGHHAVRKILRENRASLLEQIERVGGRVEMGVRVAWDVTNIFEFFVGTHPELRAARDRVLGPQRTPTQEDKIELGRMFDRILNEDREAHTEKLEEALAESCVEIKRNAPRNEQEVANLACLVERGSLAQFEAGVFAAAKQFDNNFAFDFNGPWPPFNFVDLRLEI